MTDDQKTFLFAGLAILVVVGVAVTVVRKIRTPKLEKGETPTSIEIARIVEQEMRQNGGAGTAGALLLIFTAMSLFKYFAADNVYQQMVALLLWIGNSVFWGVFLLARMIASGRISVVYRNEPPGGRATSAERREPVM
jgi:hypothetical protein